MLVDSVVGITELMILGLNVVFESKIVQNSFVELFIQRLNEFGIGSQLFNFGSLFQSIFISNKVHQMKFC